MSENPVQIGILALQGAVEPHEIKLRSLGVTPVQVRRAEHLNSIQGIILPGGESTAMLKLLHLNGLFDDLKRFVRVKPTWGICAGAILLSKKVTSPEQESLDALNIEIERNAFGRQTESFITRLTSTSEWPENPSVEGVFIRAPRIRRVFGETKILFNYQEEPVMVQEGSVLASTFHPELTDSDAIHRFFLKLVLN